MYFITKDVKDPTYHDFASFLTTILTANNKKSHGIKTAESPESTADFKEIFDGNFDGEQNKIESMFFLKYRKNLEMSEINISEN